MRKVTYFVLILLQSYVSHSQAIRGGEIIFKAGYSKINGIQHIFKMAKTPKMVEFGEQFLCIGGEIIYRNNSSLFMLDAGLGTQREQHYGQQTFKPFDGYVSFKYGYLTFHSNRVHVYPVIGGGCSMLFLTSFDKAGNVVINQRTWNLFSPAADIGVNVDLLAKKVYQDGKVWGGGIMGARVGVRVISFGRGWNDERNAEARTNLFGFYTGLVIGIAEFVDRGSNKTGNLQ